MHGVRRRDLLSEPTIDELHQLRCGHLLQLSGEFGVHHVRQLCCWLLPNRHGCIELHRVPRWYARLKYRHNVRMYELCSRSVLSGWVRRLLALCSGHVLASPRFRCVHQLLKWPVQRWLWCYELLDLPSRDLRRRGHSAVHQLQCGELSE